MPTRQYCAYCGRVLHRCGCADDDSRMQQFLARSVHRCAYTPSTMDAHYIRGVPPQIKRKVRYQLRKHYDDFYAQLADTYGECCANCGTPDDLVLDHKQSIAKGGQSELANLQLLCRECNRIKGKLCIDCYAWLDETDRTDDA